MQLSEHFTLEEMTSSETASRAGINNAAPADVVLQLQILCAGLEKIRAMLGYPLHINSGYRCPELNAAIGGAKNSQHMTGNAADFICPQFGTPVDVCRSIIASGILFDQLIYEHTWVHVSFVQDQPRGSILTLKGKSYQEGIS